jgi:beta-lactamase superfamily II metal-dependent hydrolase
MKKWHETKDTYIWVFNVGRGLSIFIRTPNNHGKIYDLGYSEDFSPIDFYKKHFIPYLSGYGHGLSSYPITQTIISHPHLDHIYEVDRLKEIRPCYITCPHDKSEDEEFDFALLSDGPKIQAYRDIYKELNPPLQTVPYRDAFFLNANAEYGIYYVQPPIVKTMHPDSDHKYGNGCSLVLYYKHGNHSVLIPGDITPEAFEHLLENKQGVEKRYSKINTSEGGEYWHYRNEDQPNLKESLSKFGLSVLVAPHHGLESCFSNHLYSIVQPNLIVISEKRTTETEGKVDSRYQSSLGSKGMYVQIENNYEFRNSVTTKSGHHYLIKLSDDNTIAVFGSKNPEDLLAK